MCIYDRHCLIVNSSGVCLSQKRDSMMCLIKPYIDLNAGVMKLTYPGIDIGVCVWVCGGDVYMEGVCVHI